MRKTKLAAAFASLLAASALGSVAIACPGNEGEAKKSPAQQQQTLASATFAVTGIKEGNAAKLKASLLKTDGIVKVDIQVQAKKIIVAFDKEKLTADQVAKIISDLGLPATAEV